MSGSSPMFTPPSTLNQIPGLSSRAFSKWDGPTLRRSSVPQPALPVTQPKKFFRPNCRHTLKKLSRSRTCHLSGAQTPTQPAISLCTWTISFLLHNPPVSRNSNKWPDARYTPSTVSSPHLTSPGTPCPTQSPSTSCSKMAHSTQSKKSWAGRLMAQTGPSHCPKTKPKNSKP